MSTQAARTYRAEDLGVYDSDGTTICACRSEADAENIATALNCHDELVDACNNLLKSFEALREGEDYDALVHADYVTKDMDQARAILAKARGEA